eukprot:755547-Hanusia_phi.AAC.2
MASDSLVPPRGPGCDDARPDSSRTSPYPMTITASPAAAGFPESRAGPGPRACQDRTSFRSTPSDGFSSQKM